MPEPRDISASFNLVSKADPAANAVDSRPVSHVVERSPDAGTVTRDPAQGVVERNPAANMAGRPAGERTAPAAWTPEAASTGASASAQRFASSPQPQDKVWSIKGAEVTGAELRENWEAWEATRHGEIGAAALSGKLGTTRAKLAANAKGSSADGMRKLGADMDEAGSAGGSDADSQAMESMQARARQTSSTGAAAAKRARGRAQALAGRSARAQHAKAKAARAYAKGNVERSAQHLAKAKRLSGSRIASARGTAASLLKSLGSKAPAIAIGCAIAATAGLLAITLLAGILAAVQSTSQAAELEGNARIIASYLLEKGVDEMHVAAIMGCLSAETGDFDPTLGETASDAGGIGICQWPTNSAYGANPPGLRLKAYAAESGREWTDIFVQLDFMWAQISGEEAESAPGISAYAASDWGWAPYADCREWRATSGVSGPASWQGFLGTADILTACGYFTYGYLRPADWAAKIEVRCFGDDMGHTGAVAFWGALLQGSGGSEGTATAVARAYGEIGKPYLWGACGPDAFDCSGLVSYCLTGTYGMRVGTTETFMGWPQVDDPQPGDICTNSHHCGIYIGSGLMVHAPHTGDYVRIGAVHADMIYVRYQG